MTGQVPDEDSSGVGEGPPAGYRGKRCFDLVVAVTVLIVMAPVFVAVWFLVRVGLGRPVLFRQRRPGFGGRIFEILKFRTMTEERGGNGELLPDKQRLTRLGRLLRATSLDELPELWNVVRGEMSLVGPRPLLPEYLSYYSPRERLRHSVRPGVTGLAQVSGRNLLSWDERLKLDVRYVESISFPNDLRILARTIGSVLGHRGAAPDVEAIGESRLDQERQESRKDRSVAGSGSSGRVE